jgi:pimeloyl-ACP methyl ester carboxylesterase
MPNVLFPVLRAALRGFGELAPRTAATWFERRLMQPRRLAQLELEPPTPTAPATRRRIQFGSSNLALTEWGDGPAVLLVHGWESDSRSLWRMVDPLVALGVRAVAFDLPAHGESGGRRTTMPDCADALLQVARAIGPVHAAVAHSFGAPVTALAVRHGLQLSRLAMLAPPRSVHAGLNDMTLQVGLPQHVFDRIAHSLATRLRFVWSELDTDWLVARLDAARRGLVPNSRSRARNR